jgi:uncharacterized membrane protein (UPF0182 family)
VGSSVLRGNLLAIPVGKSLLYVQPLYLQANQSQIPELQRVVVADQERVVMRPTFQEALAALSEGVPPAPGATATPTAAPPAPGSPADQALRARIRAARDHIAKAQEAAGKGDWATFGKEMEAAKKELEGE